MRRRVVEQQARHRHKVKAARAQALDDRRQRRDGLGAVAPAVVHEDDRSRSGAFEGSGDDRGDAWVQIVAGVHRPQHHEQVQRVQLAHRQGVEGAIRRPEQARSRAAEQFDAREWFEELFAHFVPGQPRQVSVVLGVVADGVAVADLTRRRGAEVALHPADREERRCRVVTLEHVEHARGVRPRPVVERERNIVPAGATLSDEGRV